MISLKLKNKFFVILVLTAISSPLYGTAWVEAEEIAVIMSRRIAPFEVALRGFRKVVNHPNQVYNLEGMDKKGAAKKIMRNSSPKLLASRSTGTWCGVCSPSITTQCPELAAPLG